MDPIRIWYIDLNGLLSIYHIRIISRIWYMEF